MWMVEGKQREKWDHTSAMIAALFNAQRQKGDKPVSPTQFNPFLAAESKRNRPKIKDVRFLAGLMGCVVPPKVETAADASVGEGI